MATRLRAKPRKVRVFYVAGLADQCGVSRHTIYRYLDLALLEPAGKNPFQWFTDEQVLVMAAIRRLQQDYGFRLNDIRYRIVAECSQREMATMARMSDKKLRKLLRSMGIRGI